MPDFNNIFDRFFARSQTVSKGVFLYKMAWGIEILVATIGIFLGILVILQERCFNIGSGKNTTNWFK